MTPPPTFDQFKATAQFMRRPPARRLFLQNSNTLYQVNDQRNGKLTKPADEVKRAVYDAYQLGKPDTFLADLDRDLRVIGAKA